MSTYKKLWKLLSVKEKKQIPGILCLIFFGMVLETLGIGLVIPAIALMTQNNLLESHSFLRPVVELLGGPTQVQLVVAGMLVLLGVYFFKTIFLVFMFWKQNKFTYSLQASLSDRLFKGYLNQPWSFHLQRNSAQLIRNTTTEVNLFATSALQSVMMLCTEGFVLLGILVLVVAMEPIGAPFVIGCLGLAVFVFLRSLRNHVLRLGEKRQYHEGMRIQHLQQGLGGAKDVKILGRESNFLTEYSKHNYMNSFASRQQKTLTDIPHLWIELMAVGGLVMLVLVLAAQGKPLSEMLPVLGLFAAAAFRIAPSANRIMGALQNLRFSTPVINTLYDEIFVLRNSALPQRSSLLPFKEKLQLEHVCYQYINADHQALNDISIVVPRGKSVGFIGTSGAGKSTLVDVILGLLTPVNGHVAVDGVDIQTNLRGWQDQVGYVPQSIFLTDDTLRRNIAFGLADDEIVEDAVLRAVKAAQLEEFFTNLPEGMETMVGERGVRLSGGQRQRIGIARALYHDPEILVLDEATSALDLTTEKDVMKAINSLHGEKTLLIIAHRLSTVSNCDWVYRMEKGHVVEQGPFEQLTYLNEMDTVS